MDGLLSSEPEAFLKSWTCGDGGLGVLHIIEDTWRPYSARGREVSQAISSGYRLATRR